VSDYSDFVIPWGPNWFSGKIIHHLQEVDRAKHFSTKGSLPFSALSWDVISIESILVVV